MTRVVLASVRIVRVPRSMLADTRRLLRDAGADGYEAIALWAGAFADEHTFDVTGVLRPEQHASKTSDGLLASVDGKEIFRVNKLLNDGGLRLLAQLHTHPGEAYHSETDDTFPLLSARGALSIVVPDFARNSISLETCAVYRLESGNFWRELSAADVRALFQITEG